MGEVCRHHVVWKGKSRDEREMGQFTLWLLIWKAIAGFLNCGGTLYELRQSFPADCPELDWEKFGFFLWDTGFDEEIPQHVFARKKGVGHELLVWREDDYIEMQTTGDVSSCAGDTEDEGDDDL